MKKFIWVLISLVTLSGCAEKTEQSVSALIKTVALQKYTLAETVKGYGVINTDPAYTANINLPNAGQIAQLFITLGENVKQGAPLFTFTTDPNAYLTYVQADTALKYAQQELRRLQKLFAQHLVTRSQLAAAEKAERDAALALHTLQIQGANTKMQAIKSPYTGVITTINIGQGDRVQAGASLLQVAQKDHLIIQLGLEQEDSLKVKEGMPVQLNLIGDTLNTIPAVVSKVNGIVNPQTQLVDALIRLQDFQSQKFLPGIRVVGIITVAMKNTWAVPHSAILSDKNGYYIYRIKNNRAQRVTVLPGIEDKNLVAINGDLQNGDRIVSVGNYELQDGMTVRE